jgi:all-trans-8'-apo-beta-carotenal 15,15'-oxygenase
MPARRDVLKLALAAGLAVQMPRMLAGSRDDWAMEFAAALERESWYKAFRTVPQDAVASAAQVTGAWPPELAGTLFRNGPARHELAGYRYRHWFDGDGMLQAWRMSPEGVCHQGRMIETRKFQAETAAGRALYPGFGSAPPDPAPVSSADLVNTANISVLPHHGELLALWEAGSPWRMNPDDLSTRGLYAFGSEAEGVPFSAHPRVEPDGTLWNFGYVSGAGLIALWHIDPRGKLVKMGTVPVAPMTMPHDFVVTARHLVMLLPPFHFRPTGDSGNFLDAHVWEPDQPTRVMVVDKDDFASVKWYELPAQWVFHYGNGWDDGSGVIHFDAARAPDPRVMIDTFREVMRGRRGQASPSRHHRYRIDTRNGTASEAPMFGPEISSEFPVIDPRVSTVRNRRLVFLCADEADPAPHPLQNGVAVWDDQAQQLMTFRYPDHVIPEEHLFVPAPGSEPETRGWVVGSALDTRADRLQLNVFDASALDAGPLATATLPYALPLALHGKFVAG